MARKEATWMRLGFWIVLFAAAGAAVGAAGKGNAEKAAKGGPHLNVYFTTGFDDVAWQRIAFDKVVKSWKPSSLPAPGKKTVMIATIARDGKLVGESLHMASGNAEWDKAAEDALKNAAPFPPLPKSWREPSLEVHWHFENGR